MSANARTNYDPSQGDVGVCVNCGRTIRSGQPYMGRIPFVGSWGGLVHCFCPPRLVVSTRVLPPAKTSIDATEETP